MLDPAGRHYSNKSTLQATVDLMIPPQEFRYQLVGEGLFLGECDGWYMYHHHDGTDANHGGYGGRHFPITMMDGTEKILRGPWSGGAYSVWREAGVKVVDIDLREESSPFKTYCFGYATTVEKVLEEFLPLVRPVDGIGSNLFVASIVTTEPAGSDERWSYEFAITKGTPRHLIDRTILPQWR
jgi:hypothetical protein